MREWYNGSIVAFQAIDPGSTPGSRTFYVTSSSSKNDIGQLVSCFSMLTSLNSLRA